MSDFAAHVAFGVLLSTDASSQNEMVHHHLAFVVAVVVAASTEPRCHNKLLTYRIKF